MPAHTTYPVSVEELAHRQNGGISVSLLWERETNRVTIAVDDAGCARSFELPVAPGDDAMDIFRHPYAYAGQSGT